MDMTLVPAGRADYKNIKPLFRRAFPSEERPPFFFIRRRAEQGKAQLLAAKEGDAFAGFVYLLCHADMAYLFFLAIDEAKRGTGCGSEILRLLREQYRGKRLFLARERLDEAAPNYDQRVRRHAFYLRNGFEDLPCKIKEARVVYDVMGVGGSISPAEYDALITAWMGWLPRRFIDMRVLD